MNNHDDAPEPQTWPTRPRTRQEEAERASRLEQASRSRVLIRKLVGTGIWAATLVTMVAMFKTTAGRTCDLADDRSDTYFGADAPLAQAACPAEVDNLGNVVLVAFVGLVLGVIAFVPGQRDYHPAN